MAMQRRVRWLALGFALVLATGAPALAQSRTIRVVEGDTLEQLALRYRVNLEALIELNGISDPTLLQVGQVLKLPGASNSPQRPASSELAPPPPEGNSGEAAAALLLSPAERRDRAELEWREQSGQARWKWFNSTAVDWSGWKLHPGGVRITLVQPALADVGARRSGATAIAVQCSSLRHTWRIDGDWERWSSPGADSVAQRIVLQLCSNTLDGPAAAIPPPPDSGQ
jgi:murein DD-endopeptidase MepM/ murein hydrolase activator NlpD